jgi:hypothetical protein
MKRVLFMVVLLLGVFAWSVGVVSRSFAPKIEADAGQITMQGVQNSIERAQGFERERYEAEARRIESAVKVARREAVLPGVLLGLVLGLCAVVLVLAVVLVAVVYRRDSNYQEPRRLVLLSLGGGRYALGGDPKRVFDVRSEPDRVYLANISRGEKCQIIK